MYKEAKIENSISCKYLIICRKMRKDEKKSLQSEQTDEIRNPDGIMSPSLSTSALSEDLFCSSKEESSDSGTSEIE